jgi:hypothetical protein
MRLASKIFLALAVVVVALVGVAVLSLRALDRLVDVNRVIVTETLPALRLVTSARDAVLALGRLEARYLALRDAQYAALWDERAMRAVGDLDTLRGFVTGRREAAALAEARAAFDEYRTLVADGRALISSGDRQAALRLAETRGQQLIERVESSLETLAQERHAAVVRAQTSAARLESRTWTGVLVALAAGGGGGRPPRDALARHVVGGHGGGRLRLVSRTDPCGRPRRGRCPCAFFQSDGGPATSDG